MPYYKNIFDLYDSDPTVQNRIGQCLMRLRRQMHEDLPARNVEHSLLLATWNIWELGRNQKFGARLPESFSHIAEVLSGRVRAPYRYASGGFGRLHPSVI